MTRYKLPEELGGGEFESVKHGEYEISQGGCVYIKVGDTNIGLPRHLLTEVPPPIPPEPEPGAYLIGKALAYRDLTVGAVRWHWQIRAEGRSASYRPWAETWEKHGGPDVAIVPLIPDPAHGVTLPWMGPNITVQTRPGVVRLGVTPTWTNLAPEAAEEMAAALLAAAKVTQ